MKITFSGLVGTLVILLGKHIGCSRRNRIIVEAVINCTEDDVTSIIMQQKKITKIYCLKHANK